ncbi:MAG: FAD-dependent oxidoreductase [Acidobacteriota bacterium]
MAGDVFDAIVIGTGQSGPALAARLAGSGMKVAIVERRRFGGTCVNNGCIPTKTLVASARAAYVVRRASDFGVQVGGPVFVDMRAVKARKDGVVRKSTEGVEKWLRGTKNCTVLQGHARFEGPRSVRVGEQLLESEKIFVNVGGRAAVPPIPGLDGVPFLTNSSMMDVDFLPEHLVILGGSYIALEFAQMYRRFGSEVTVIERGPRLLARDDEDVADAIRGILEGEGVRIATGTDIRSVEQRAGRPVVHVSSGGKVEVAGSHLLAALGRVPNTGRTSARPRWRRDELGAASSRCWTTSAPARKASGRSGTATARAFTHVVQRLRDRLPANLLDEEAPEGRPDHLAYGLFIDPPLGAAGSRRKEVRESEENPRSWRGYRRHAWAGPRRSETLGFMKVLVKESKLILGAALLGIEADRSSTSSSTSCTPARALHLIQRVHIHPTVSELLPTLLELEPLSTCRDGLPRRRRNGQACCVGQALKAAR